MSANARADPAFAPIFLIALIFYMIKARAAERVPR